jgi:DNA-binding MarR family transcriptional regulator
MEPAEQLYLAIQHSARHFRQLDTELGLSPARFSVLAILRYEGAHRLGDLARREGVAQPTMTKLVAGLERDHLVIRRADSGDHRGVIVDLTADGRALVRRARARKIDWIGKALREASELDVQAAGRTAERLDQAAGTAAAPIIAEPSTFSPSYHF